MSAHVYTYWDGEQPLYVGVTIDVLRRMEQHIQKRKPWTKHATHVTVRDYAIEANAYAAEVRLIQHLEPLYNKMHNPRWKRFLYPHLSPEELLEGDRLAAQVVFRGIFGGAA